MRTSFTLPSVKQNFASECNPDRNNIFSETCIARANSYEGRLHTILFGIVNGEQQQSDSWPLPSFDSTTTSLFNHPLPSSLLSLFHFTRASQLLQTEFLLILCLPPLCPVRYESFLLKRSIVLLCQCLSHFIILSLQSQIKDDLKYTHLCKTAEVQAVANL